MSELSLAETMSNNETVSTQSSPSDRSSEDAKALWRAALEKAPADSNLIINYLPPLLSEEELHNLFSPYGMILYHKIIKDLEHDRSLGYAFVLYSTAEAASKAIQAMNGYTIDDKKLKVSLARPASQDLKRSNLYVTNMPLTWTKEDMMNFFLPYGHIVEARVLHDPNTGQFRGVGFCRLETHQAALNAINSTHNVIPHDGTEKLQVKLADIPSRYKSNRMKQAQAAAAAAAAAAANNMNGGYHHHHHHPHGGYNSGGGNHMRGNHRGGNGNVHHHHHNNNFGHHHHHNAGMPGGNIGGGNNIHPHHGGYMANIPGGGNGGMSQHPSSAPSSAGSIGGYAQQQPPQQQQQQQLAAHFMTSPYASYQSPNGNDPSALQNGSFGNVPSIHQSRINPNNYQQQVPTSYINPSGIGLPASQMSYNGHPNTRSQIQPNHMNVGLQGAYNQSNQQSGAGSQYKLNGPSSASGGAGLPQQQQHQGICLFVYHLPLDASDLTLYQIFSPYATVLSTKVMKDSKTGRSRGFGFVNVLTEQDGKHAIAHLQNLRLGNKYIKISFKDSDGGNPHHHTQGGGANPQQTNHQTNE